MSKTRKSRKKSPKTGQTAKPSKTIPRYYYFLPLAVLCALAIGLFAVFTSIDRAQTAAAIAELATLSNSDHGATYDEVVANVQADMPPYEVIFVFDRDGQKLVEYTNEDQYTVSLPDDILALLRPLRGLTHMHCHPLHDNGHSDMDLTMLDRTGLTSAVRTLAVVTDQHVYTIDRNGRKWATEDEVYQYFWKLSLVVDDAITSGLFNLVMIDGKELPYMTNYCLDGFADYFGYTFSVTPEEALS